MIKKNSAPKRSKYGNIKTEYNGNKYDSKAEALYAKQLDYRKLSGEVISWERQVPVRLEVNGQLVCKYIADFKVLLSTGKFQWVDVKGVETDVFKLKHKLMKALYPEIELLIVGKSKITKQKKNVKKIK